MDFFRASFFGHRKVYDFNNVEREVYGIICRLIKGNEYVDFLVGREGDFDQIVSSSVRRAKKEVFDANSSLVWVQPYLRADFRDHPEEYEAYYDSIEVCSESEVAHPKAAIQIRNRAMVDRSDLCVFYVARNNGGAWQTMQYAKRQNKKILNIYDLIKEES